MDARSVTHDTVPDNAHVTSTDPSDTYTNTLVTSKTKVKGRGHVQTHCTANPTSDSEVQFCSKVCAFPWMRCQ